MGKQVLMFRSANVQQTGRALQRIKGRFPDARVTLLLSAHDLKHFAENPFIDRVCTYDTGRDGVFKAAINLIRDLRRQRFDLLVILSAVSVKIAAPVRCHRVLALQPGPAEDCA